MRLHELTNKSFESADVGKTVIDEFFKTKKH